MLIKDTESTPEFLAGDHTIIKELLNPKQDNVQADYSLALAKVPIGKTSLPHRLSGSEIYYILQGIGEMHIDEEVETLTKGQLVFIPPNAMQYIKNVGEEELIFLCVVNPPWHDTTEEVY